MRRILGSFLALLFLVPLGATAQEETPEMGFLNWGVGSFEYDHIEGGGDCKKVGDYVLHCMSAWTTTSGNEVEAIWITRLNPETGELTAFRFYNNGYADSGRVWIDGDTAVTVYELPGGARARITQTWSEDTVTYVWHRSVQGGAWEETSEGSMTRVGSGTR